MQFNDSCLNLPKLEQAINRRPTLIAADTLLVDVLSLMGLSGNQSVVTGGEWVEENEQAEGLRNLSCNYVVVMENNRILGVFTERNLVELIASGFQLDRQITIANLITKPPVTLRFCESENIFTPLSFFQRYQTCYLPIVNDEQELLGIVTPTTILQGLKLTNLFKLGTVGEVMNTEILSTDRTTSVEKLAQLMRENQVNSLVITDVRKSENIVPIGVVTERQIAQAWALGMDIKQTPASLIMRRMGEELNPTNSLLYAYQQMQSDRMDTLLVSPSQSEFSGGQWGIITTMELLRSLEPIQIYRRLKRTQQFVQQLQVEKAQLLSRRNAELTAQVQQQTEQLRQESEKLKQQVQQAKLINQITQAMRGTLVLDEIFQTTVNQLHEALKVSRCLIFRPNSDYRLAIHHVSEATSEGNSLIGVTCNFYQLYDAQLSQGKPLILSEINSATPTEIQEAAQGCKIRAIMIMPLIYQQNYIGGISLHQCDRQREWTEDEVAFVKAIADHCAIAIHQAKLYQQLQTELQERQKAEVALREQKQFLQDIIDTNPNLIFVKDCQGKFVLANQACADILGINVEQMLGKTDAELNPESGEAEQFNYDDREVITTRKTKFIPEESLTKVTGEVRWLQTVKKPILSSDGQNIQVLGVATDITERKVAETALQKLNSLLEVKVAERTEQLNQIIRGLAKEIVQHKNTEAALKESEKRFRNLVETSSDLVWEVNENAFYTYVSPQIKEILGYEPEEVLGKSIFDFVPAEEVQRITKIFASLVAMQQPFNCLENAHVHKNGNSVVLETSGVPIFDERGLFKGYRGIDRDITERKLAEASLRESQSQLQAILDNLPAVMYVYDTEDRYLLINRQYETLFNVTKEEIISQTVYDFWPKEIADIFSTNNRLVREQGISVHTEEIAPHEDGLHTYITVKFPLRNTNGKIYAVCGISTDITDRKQAEKALQESQAKLQKLAASVPGMIYQYILHPDGSHAFPYVSPGCSKIWELEPEEMQSNPQLAFDIIHPEDLPSIVESTKISAQSLQPWQWEGRLITPSGKLKWVQGISRPEKQENGDILWDGLFIDISDRKLTEAALSESERRLRIALNAANMGTWDWEIPTSKITWSEQTEIIFGHTPGTFPGNYQAYLNLIHPSDRHYLTTEISRAIEQKIPYNVEHRIILSDGSIRWIAGKGDVICNQLGQTLGMSGVVMDITERRQAEVALRDSEYKLRTIVESSNDSIFLKDKEGRYLFINRVGAEILERSVEEILGKRDDELFTPELGSKIWELDHKIMMSGIAWTFEELGEVKGKKYTFLSTKSPYLSSEGEPIGLVGVCRDITESKEIEQKMRRQIAAVEAATDGIAIVNAAGEYIYINESHVKIFGYENADELIGKTWQVLYNDEELKRIEQEVIPIVGQKGKWQGEATAKKRDGTTFTEELSLTLTPDGGLICVCRDITERKGIEESLRLRNRAIAASNNGIIITDARIPNKPIIYVNPAFEQMTGYSAAEVLGKNCRFLQGKETKQGELERLRTAIRQGENCTVVIRNYRKDGSLFWNELSISPIYDDRGVLTHFIGIQIDITERKQAEEELRATTSRLSTLIENLQLGILVKDESDLVVLLNQAFCDIFNIPIVPAALIGADFSDFLETYQHCFTNPAQVIQRHNEILESQTATTNEEITMADGRILERDYAPIFVQGNYKGYLWMYRDITERKTAETEMITSLKEKELLLKEIHHRVKNNLQVISSLLKLQSSYIKDEEALALFTESYNRVRSMALIHEKLYQSKGLARIDAVDYIRDLTDNLFRSYNVATNTIELHLRVEHIELDIDTAIPCGLIINELVSNSLKYAFVNQGKGELYINLFYQEGTSKVTLLISDNGIGLPPNFDITELESLGLQLVYNLTEQLNGEMEINSDRGAKFTITFTNRSVKEK
ncbi:PAS domain S-box protein [Aerosakkonemataceae cyanobacterium BLCC-F154]|uniref:histidine kinase n=1 Tax=Floridaenema fluviatile BLCC-F154 TaxID=3153640 RepID=A0ABV4Y5Z6_9CYAN